MLVNHENEEELKLSNSAGIRHSIPCFMFSPTFSGELTTLQQIPDRVKRSVTSLQKLAKRA